MMVFLGVKQPYGPSILLVFFMMMKESRKREAHTQQVSDEGTYFVSVN